MLSGPSGSASQRGSLRKHAGAGERQHVGEGQRAGIAAAGLLRDAPAVEQQHALPRLGQPTGRRHPDNACADHGDVDFGGLVHAGGGV